MLFVFWTCRGLSDRPTSSLKRMQYELPT